MAQTSFHLSLCNNISNNLLKCHSLPLLMKHICVWLVSNGLVTRPIVPHNGSFSLCIHWATTASEITCFEKNKTMEVGGCLSTKVLSPRTLITTTWETRNLEVDPPSSSSWAVFSSPYKFYINMYTHTRQCINYTVFHFLFLNGCNINEM